MINTISEKLCVTKQLLVNEDLEGVQKTVQANLAAQLFGRKYITFLRDVENNFISNEVLIKMVDIKDYLAKKNGKCIVRYKYSKKSKEMKFVFYSDNRNIKEIVADARKDVDMKIIKFIIITVLSYTLLVFLYNCLWNISK